MATASAGGQGKGRHEGVADVWGLEAALAWIFLKRKLEIDLEEGQVLNKQAWQLRASQSQHTRSWEDGGLGDSRITPQVEQVNRSLQRGQIRGNQLS